MLSELKSKLIEHGVQDRDLTITEGHGYLTIVDKLLPSYPILLAVSDDVMNCWINIIPVDGVREDCVQELDSLLLRYNDLSGLSTLSISTDNQYKISGRLSAQSKIESIVQEVDSLFNGLGQSLEFFVDYLK